MRYKTTRASIAVSWVWRLIFSPINQILKAKKARAGWFGFFLYGAPHVGHRSPILRTLSQYSHFTNPFNRRSCSSVSLKKHSSQTRKFPTGIVISWSCNPFLRPHVVILRFSIRMKLTSSFFANFLLHDLHVFLNLKSCKLFHPLSAQIHLNLNQVYSLY